MADYTYQNSFVHPVQLCYLPNNYHKSHQSYAGRSFHKVYSEDSINSMTEYTNIYTTKRSVSFEEDDEDMNSYSSVYGTNENSFNSSQSAPIKPTKMISKKKAKEIDFVVNFKTEICKYWEQNGHCHFGPKCAFAHGEFELRKKSNVLSGYKAKRCVHFHLEAYCPYGRRCQFLHSLRPASPETFETSSYQEKISDPAFFDAQQAECICKARPRLPAFSNITENEPHCSHSSCC